MKVTSAVLAFAATVAAYQLPEKRQDTNGTVVTSTVTANATMIANATSVNASFVQSVLETALPSSLLAVAITNPAAASSIIGSVRDIPFLNSHKTRFDNPYRNSPQT